MTAEPTKTPAPLPATRDELTTRHAELRRKRNAADGGSPEWKAAVFELERVEIEIARLDRAADPPRV